MSSNSLIPVIVGSLVGIGVLVAVLLAWSKCCAKPDDGEGDKKANNKEADDQINAYYANLQLSPELEEMRNIGIGRWSDSEATWVMRLLGLVVVGFGYNLVVPLHSQEDITSSFFGDFVDNRTNRDRDLGFVYFVDEGFQVVRSAHSSPSDRVNRFFLYDSVEVSEIKPVGFASDAAKLYIRLSATNYAKIQSTIQVLTLVRANIVGRRHANGRVAESVDQTNIPMAKMVVSTDVDPANK
mmetsp:Transcript_22361/g.39563  ORF Transcript_22361/g.39563 Transcript_22361/m.39563 type:complete len:240 (-) Transcript_22361:96-815(-)